MMDIQKNLDIQEGNGIEKYEKRDFKEIKPQGALSVSEARSYFDNLFQEMHDKKRLSGDDALEKALNDPESLASQTDSEEDADEVRELCDDIKHSVNNDDDVIVHDGLYSEYEKMIESGEYENEEDLCNGEGLNYDDIYDVRSERYGDEYEQGFKDGWDSVDDENHDNEAYNQGVNDAEKLTSLCGRYCSEASHSDGAGENSENANDAENNSNEYSDLNSMKRELGKTYSEIKEDKPPNSPNIAKWFENGGSIRVEEIDGKQVWTYTDSEGRSVQYIDGKVKFPPEAKHPVIGDISIGEFTGDRNKDKQLYLEKLEEEYGLTEIPDGYALHHDTENGVLQLVRTDYHKEFTHAGGHSMYKEDE